MARQSEQGWDRKGGPSATDRTDFYVELGAQGNMIPLSFHKTTLPPLLSREQTEGQGSQETPLIQVGWTRSDWTRLKRVSRTDQPGQRVRSDSQRQRGETCSMS